MAKRRFAALPRIARNTARGEAIKLFETGQPIDLEAAEIELDHRLRMTVGSMWITLAVALALELLKRWLSRREQNPQFHPEAVFVTGEPGIEDADWEDFD